jgi:peptide/nickel transport system permease protein
MSTLKRLLKNPLSASGIALIALFFFITIAAPWLAPPKSECPSPIYYWIPDWALRVVTDDIPCQPYKIPRLIRQDGFIAKPLPPNPDAWGTFPPNWELHPLGTTEDRYDIWYGIIWGTRTALFAGLIIVFFSFSIGLIVGATAGFFRGRVDGLLMRFVDFVIAMPAFLATLILVSVLGRGLEKIIIASVLFGWTNYARLVRADILSMREREFVQAARANGVGNVGIIFRHVIPNMIYPAIIVASLDVGSVVLGLSTLSFLGLGSGADYADWGQMIALARNRIAGLPGQSPLEYWYTFFYPGLAIFLFVLAWNLIGDTVRDVLDPKQRRKTN